MDKNQFYLYNETLYRILTCRSLEELKRTILRELRLMIPYRYGSIITVRHDPKTGTVSHCEPVCIPEELTDMENAWISQAGEDDYFWLSSSQESIVLRGSDVQSDEVRLHSTIYRIYQRYDIYDSMEVNLVYERRTLALLALYRTRQDEPFSEQDAFFLKSIIRHINFLYYRLLNAQAEAQDSTALQLKRRYHLTERETEITSLLFQHLSNDEMVERLFISKNTLDKHLSSIYRKCGVSSRVKLLQMKEIL